MEGDEDYQELRERKPPKEIIYEAEPPPVIVKPQEEKQPQKTGKIKKPPICLEDV